MYLKFCKIKKLVSWGLSWCIFLVQAGLLRFPRQVKQLKHKLTVAPLHSSWNMRGWGKRLLLEMSINSGAPRHVSGNKRDWGKRLLLEMAINNGAHIHICDWECERVREKVAFLEMAINSGAHIYESGNVRGWGKRLLLEIPSLNMDLSSWSRRRWFKPRCPSLQPSGLSGFPNKDKN